MTISVGGVSQSCQAYQFQERIADRVREQGFQKAVDQGDRVTLSVQARDLAAQALAAAEASDSAPRGFQGPVEPTQPPGI